MQRSLSLNQRQLPTEGGKRISASPAQLPTQWRCSITVQVGQFPGWANSQLSKAGISQSKSANLQVRPTATHSSCNITVQHGQFAGREGASASRAPPLGCDGFGLNFNNPGHAYLETLKALANFSPGPGPPCGQPARGGSVALWQPWGFCSTLLLVATLKELRPIEVTNLIQACSAFQKWRGQDSQISA